MPDDVRAMLDELERMEKAATPGEWYIGRGNGDRAECRFLFIPLRDGIEYGAWPNDEQNMQLIAAARNALPTLLRLARRGLAAGEVVEEIAETCENLQRAAMLNVGDYIHVQGLRGGVEKIKAMADAALARLAEKEER